MHRLSRRPATAAALQEGPPLSVLSIASTSQLSMVLICLQIVALFAEPWNGPLVARSA